MAGDTRPWVIVLAAGEGQRLWPLTTEASGRVVPKQYWRFGEPRTLLGSTIRRARMLTEPDRIVVVVADGHRFLWERHLRGQTRGWPLIQPLNRGTAPGLLLPLRHVFARDPAATVIVLPSDHCITREGPFLGVLRDAAVRAGSCPAVTILGMTPEAPERGYGWIVPATGSGRSARVVSRFVEKPDRVQAVRLQRCGALWSSLVMVGRVGEFLDLYDRAQPELLQDFFAIHEVLGRPADEPPRALRELYEGLEHLDFSRGVLEPCARRLRVADVPSCGWTDIGTPERALRWMLGRRGVPAEAPGASVPVAPGARVVVPRQPPGALLA